jgi:molecular chaperone GrpE
MSDIDKIENNSNTLSNNNLSNNQVNDNVNISKEELNEQIQDNAIEELLILKQTIEEKNEMIEKLKKENEETKDLLIRLKADFENYKKRVREEQKDMVKFSNQKLISDLLPVLDDLDRAIESVSDELKNSTFFDGLNMVVKSFHNILEKKYYLEKIKDEKVVFDPHFHEALSVVEDNNTDGMIVDKILQPGYKIDSRVLRSAKVVVRKGSDKAQKEDNTKDDNKVKESKESLIDEKNSSSDEEIENINK